MMRPFSESLRPQFDGGSLAGLHCLVLGAGGFIGTALCRALCDRGAEVQGFGRAPTYVDAIDPRVTWTTGDFADTAALAKAVDGQQIVFHLISGSVPSSSTIQIAADFVPNTQGTLALLDICRSAGVRKIIFASSGGTVYGVGSGEPLSEMAATDPISAYGVTKLTIEKFLLLYHLHFGLDFQILRLANPYGPHQSPLRRQGVVAAILYRALTRKPVEIWGDGDVTRDFIYVDDVARAFVEMVNYSGRHKLMNVGSGEGRSINQVIKDINQVISPVEVETVLRAGRATDVPVNILDPGLIMAETDWHPRVSWLEGVSATASWMKDQVLS